MNSSSENPSLIDTVRLVAKALDEKKAEDICVLNVSKLSSITDYLVLATGNSEPHLRALRVELEKALDAAKVHIIGMDTNQGSGWMVVDAFDVMVHVFTPETRANYKLETLWKDAEKVSLESLIGASAPASAAGSTLKAAQAEETSTDVGVPVAEAVVVEEVPAPKTEPSLPKKSAKKSVVAVAKPAVKTAKAVPAPKALKAAKVAKPVKAGKKAEPASKTTVKKPAVKKPAAKKSAKPVAKTTSKPAVKKIVKPAAKKAVSKKAAKPLAKKLVKKSVAKVSAKKPVSKTTKKVAAKAVAKKKTVKAPAKKVLSKVTKKVVAKSSKPVKKPLAKAVKKVVAKPVKKVVSKKTAKARK